MTISPLMAFAGFLKNHHYSTSMWEGGYTPEAANEVCHQLTHWANEQLQIPGEFIILWTQQDGVRFSGDSELAYTVGGHAYLLPNPFIEGDFEGFVAAMSQIMNGSLDGLYRVQVKSRILYNAI